jgi:hypothetical protein
VPKFSEDLKQDQRLFVLRLLAELPGYSSNVSALQSALALNAGHHLSRDAALGLVDWLAEMDLVGTEQLDPNIRVVNLTTRGSDVAAGTAIVTGVKRPRAGV